MSQTPEIIFYGSCAIIVKMAIKPSAAKSKRLLVASKYDSRPSTHKVLTAQVLYLIYRVTILTEPLKALGGELRKFVVVQFNAQAWLVRQM